MTEKTNSTRTDNKTSTCASSTRSKGSGTSFLAAVLSTTVGVVLATTIVECAKLVYHQWMHQASSELKKQR